MCATFGVEHETAVSVESDLPFVLMGFVLFVVIFWRLVYVRVKVNMKEPRPEIKFKKVGNDRKETMRAKYMRVHRRNRRAQDSVTEGHPNRMMTGHRMASFPVVISLTLQSYQLTRESMAMLWAVGSKGRAEAAPSQGRVPQWQVRIPNSRSSISIKVISQHVIKMESVIGLNHALLDAHRHSLCTKEEISTAIRLPWRGQRT